MTISRILVSFIIVNLYLCCYTSGDAVEDPMKSELAQVEKELEKLAVEDAAREMANDNTPALTTQDLAEENTLVANDVGKDAATYKKEASSINGILEMTINELMKNVLSKKEVSEDSAAVCKDVRADCKELKGILFCESHKASMKKVCQKTCNLCPIASKCRNSAGDAKCKKLVNYPGDLCRQKKWKAKMQKLCFKSCRYCAMPNAPNCTKTDHGCCWDKVTVKQDKEGSNCDACKNQYRYLCKTFSADCRSPKKAGAFMRKYCPETCQLCGAKPICLDDAVQASFCPVWAKDGWCTNEFKDTMQVYCRKTCDMC